MAVKGQAIQQEQVVSSHCELQPALQVQAEDPGPLFFIPQQRPPPDMQLRAQSPDSVHGDLQSDSRCKAELAEAIRIFPLQKIAPFKRMNSEGKGKVEFQQQVACRVGSAGSEIQMEPGFYLQDVDLVVLSDLVDPGPQLVGKGPVDAWLFWIVLFSGRYLIGR